MHIIYLINIAVITTKIDLLLSKWFGHQLIQLTFRK